MIARLFTFAGFAWFALVFFAFGLATGALLTFGLMLP